jgi:hypothetical protein
LHWYLGHLERRGGPEYHLTTHSGGLSVARVRSVSSHLDSNQLPHERTKGDSEANAVEPRHEPAGDRRLRGGNGSECSRAVGR